ncbi:MAG: hypothetical protein MZW92_60320 [Comamonadaceae bacterium]|nr:hypothetical protein [Comamonadaceae bacterium]
MRGGLKDGFVKTSRLRSRRSARRRARNADAVKGRDDGRQLRHLRRRAQGQHRQGRDPEGHDAQADRHRA